MEGHLFKKWCNKNYFLPFILSCSCNVSPPLSHDVLSVPFVTICVYPRGMFGYEDFCSFCRRSAIAILMRKEKARFRKMVHYIFCISICVKFEKGGTCTIVFFCSCKPSLSYNVFSIPLVTICVCSLGLLDMRIWFILSSFWNSKLKKTIVLETNGTSNCVSGNLVSESKSCSWFLTLASWFAMTSSSSLISPSSQIKFL